MSDTSVQHRRGLPPPPCGAFISPDTPPPSPREMYTQSGIYDVIPGEKATRRPPPPRRSSSTRLSSGRDRVSVSSDDPVFIEDPHRSTNRHSPHQSPRLSRSPKQPQHAQGRRTSSPVPAIPSPNRARPFSYVSALPSSPQPSDQHRDLSSPGSPTYEPIKQSHAQNGHRADGHRKSSNPDARTFQPSHNAPYQRPSAGGSPNTPRRQSMPVRPVTPPQHARDTNLPPQQVRDMNFPQHVKPYIPTQLDVMKEQELRGPSVNRHRPQSFPAPPTPLSGSVRSHGSMRSPSPPLPPPPSEMDGGQQVSNVHFRNRQASGSEPPTPPPISKIPGNRSSVSSFELGKRVREGSVDMSPVQSPTHPLTLGLQLNKVQLKAAPPAEPEKEAFKHAAMGIAAELGKVQLRSSPKDAPKSSTPQGSQEISSEARLVKLNPVKATGGSKTTPERETESTGIKFVAKLKSTGGPKPWEKDTSPPSNVADAGVNVMTSSLDDEPLPPPPSEGEPLTELPLPPPPPPPEDKGSDQPLTPDSMETPSTTAGKENLKKRKMFEKGKKDTGDNMEIDLDEIDYSQIPGYVPITNAVPNWKKDMIIKKNEEKVREYLEELRRKKAEEMKWKDVPEWKRKMLEKKEKEKREQEEVMTQAQREDEERKRQEKKRQIEMQAQMEKELADVPEWKREIMMKKGAAPTNWGDEREDINRDEEEANENHD